MGVANLHNLDRLQYRYKEGGENMKMNKEKISLATAIISLAAAIINMVTSLFKGD